MPPRHPRENGTDPGNGNGDIVPGSGFHDVIPEEFSSQIIEEAAQQSVVLRLGNTVPMGTRITHMPVPRAFPNAGWSSVPYGARKPYTDMALGLETMTAEEVAAVTAIPDAMVDDTDINLWAWVRPRLAEAIAIAIDNAVLFGLDAPATFPDGGVSAHAVEATVGDDVVATINDAMGQVEDQGLAVTGSAADLGVRSVLRGVRDQSGALLLGAAQTDSGSIDTLYGVPVAYDPFPRAGDADFFTGAWDNLIIGVRQDIRFQLDSSGVLVDEDGRVVVSAFQDNVTLLKVWARFACVIIDPVTQREPDGATPFAKAELVEEHPRRARGRSSRSQPRQQQPQQRQEQKAPATA
ncbi:MAG: phage major capsid protein [Nocardiopsaceae bacterium]|jgi:HK97 family phage major capsid protein|nr:phage major capsid protein [Nocardiopsaceae bacterium]